MSENIHRQSIEKPSDRIIVAFDNMTWEEVISLGKTIGSNIGMGKINSLAQNEGWARAVYNLGMMGMNTMADAKFHDIPKTVELHVREVAKEAPQLITVHASGGREMLEAAIVGRKSGLELALSNPFYYGATLEDIPQAGILGITVLTSLDTEECVSIFGDEPEKKVVQFAHLAAEAGIDGIVCSGKELRAIRAISALDSLITVVPGITPLWTKKAGDQKRVVTPAEALQEGADFIVVGRAITQPPEGISSKEAAQRIAEELKAA